MTYKLQKKGKFWHYTIHINGKRKRGSTRATSKELALQYTNKIHNDLYQKGHGLSTPKISVKGFIDRHIRRDRGNNLSPEWIYIKELTLDTFRKFLLGKGILMIDQIDLAHLETYKDLLLKKNKPVTVSKTMSIICTLLNHAVKLNFLSANPANQLERIRDVKRSRQRFLSKKEIEIALNATKGTYLENFVLTAIYSGLRRRELIHLEFSDIDFNKKLLYVRNKEGFKTKSRKDRVVEIHKKLWPFFKKKREGLCFPYEGRLVQEDTASRNFKSIMIKAGINDVGLHTLRHTFISHCLMDGIPIWRVSKWAGHSSVYITEMYGHLCPDSREIDRLKI